MTNCVNHYQAVSDDAHPLCWVDEVNLCFKKELFDQHGAWFYAHIQDMAKQSGFIKTNIYDEICLDPSNDDALREHKLTVHYFIASYEHLMSYLEAQATSMRNQVVERFGSHYTAKRRIFRVRDMLSTAEGVIKNV